jgi:hypothetical protein
VGLLEAVSSVGTPVVKALEWGLDRGRVSVENAIILSVSIGPIGFGMILLGVIVSNFSSIAGGVMVVLGCVLVLLGLATVLRLIAPAGDLDDGLGGPTTPPLHREDRWLQRQGFRRW